MNYTNTTGYTAGSDTEKNGINIIPSSKITMKNVNKSLTLIPVINGKPQYSKKVIAKPGDDDIDFGPDVTSVIEVPMAQSQWGTIGDTVDEGFRKKNPFAPNSNTQHTYGSFGTPNSNTTGFTGGFPPLNVKDPGIPSDDMFGTQKQEPGVNANFEDIDYQGTPQWQIDASKEAISQNRQPVTTTGNDSNIKYLSSLNPYGTADLGTSMYKSGIGFGISKYGKSSGQKAAGLTLGIASAAQGILGSARNFFSGMGEAKRYGQAEEEMKRRRLLAMQEEGTYDTMVGVDGQGQTLGYKKGGFIDFLKKGGYTKPEPENTEKREVDPKMLTGNFLQGNDTHPDPNAELEAGEYVRTPEGQTMEIVGKKHSEGGELVNLPEETKVISDYVKVGATNAKNMEKFYDIKVSANSTFASVVDKFRKSIGLTAMLEDEEELIKKVAAQEQVTNKETKDLNYKVLSKRLTTIQEQKAPLEDKLREFIDYVFDEQEKYKVEKGITTDNDKKQTGGEVTEASPDELIAAYAGKNGIDPRDLMAELESMEESERQVRMTEIMSSARNTPPTEEAQPQGGQISPEQIITAFAEQQGISPEEIMQNLQQLPPEEQEQVFQEMAAAVSGEQGQPQGEVSPEQIIMAYAEQQGVDPQQIVAELEEMGEEDQQAMMTQMMESVGSAPTPEMKKGGTVEYQVGGEIKEDDFDKKYASYTGFGTYAADDLEAKRLAAQKYIEQYDPSTVGKIDYSNKTQEDLNKMITAIRKRKTTDLPQTSVYFGKNVVADRAGLQFMLDKKMISPSSLKEMGVQISKDGTIKRGAFDTIDENQKKVLKAKIDETLALPQNKKLADEYAIQTYDDSLWDRREYMVEPKKFKSAAERDKWIKEKGYKETDKGVYATDKEGLFVRPEIEDGTPVGPGASGPGPDNSQTRIKPLQRDEDGFLMLPPQLPGRENLPPNLLMPTLRQTRAFQADPLAISPNSTIRETARSVRSQQQLLEQMDPSLAAGNIANLTAEEANANANAIEKANLANQADRRQVDTLNEDRQKTALDTNLNLQANYEQLGQTALQNFYDENRNFITKRNNDNIENWNVTNKINAYNAANPNYKMTSSGAIVQVGRPFFWADSGEPLDDNTELFEDAEGIYAQKNGKKVRVNKNENKPGLVPSLSPAPMSKKGGKISYSDYLKKSK